MSFWDDPPAGVQYYQWRSRVVKGITRYYLLNLTTQETFRMNAAGKQMYAQRIPPDATPLYPKHLRVKEGL